MNCQYPAYYFEESTDKDFTNPCDEDEGNESRLEARKKFEKNSELTKSKIKSFFLNLDLAESKEYRRGNDYKGGMKNPTKDKGQQFRVEWIKNIEIKWRPSGNSKGKEYVPFGQIIVRKVLQCDKKSQSKKMTDAAFGVEFFPMNDELRDPIIVDRGMIKDLDLGDDQDWGLVSINDQINHSKLLDFFLKKEIPKSVANFLIKEINVAEPRR